jgi:hypothetical protein
VIQDVCFYFNQLPATVQTGTSIDYACKADWGKVCNDPAVKNFACPNGSVQTSLCELEPEKCTAGSSTYDQCYENFEHCLVRPDWKLCDSVPKLCDLTWTTTGTNGSTNQNSDGSTTTVYTDPTTGAVTEITSMVDGTTITKTVDATTQQYTEVKTNPNTHTITTTVGSSGGSVASITDKFSDGTVTTKTFDSAGGETTTTTHPQCVTETTASTATGTATPSTSAATLRRLNTIDTTIAGVNSITSAATDAATAVVT